MDNTMYVGLSRQMTLRREMDLIANNIANQDTAGFKVENLMQTDDPEGPARMADGPRPIKFVIDNGVGRDFGQGTLSATGADFDLAIEGQGFFQVQTPAGDRFTRDGRFSLDANGTLITKDGRQVIGDGGPITVDPTKGAVAIARDGTLSQAGQKVGKVSVMRFDNLSDLRKDGDNLYRSVSNAAPQAAPDAVVHQGMIESSNVRPIEQISRMIEVNRAYDTVSKLMDQTAELSRSAIGRIGKAA